MSLLTSPRWEAWAIQALQAFWHQAFCVPPSCWYIQAESESGQNQERTKSGEADSSIKVLLSGIGFIFIALVPSIMPGME